MSSRRRQARTALLSVPAPPPPPSKRRPRSKTAAPPLAGDIVAPALQGTSAQSPAIIQLAPDERLYLAFDVGLVSLSWCVLRARPEARGRPSVGIQYKDWIRHRGTFHWEVLTWDWINILSENEVAYKKAKRAGEVNRSFAVVDSLLTRSKSFYLNQLTDIVVEAQDNRNPLMRAVASSILSTFAAYYRVTGRPTPETHVYSGSRKMRAIEAWNEDRKDAEENGTITAEPEIVAPPPPPKGRLIKSLARGGARSAKSTTVAKTKKVGPRGKRDKAAYKKRKCAAVDTVDQMIELGMVSVGLERYEIMKQVFKKRKGPNAGDDMADALLHAINRAWVVCKPSIKRIPIVWDTPNYTID